MPADNARGLKTSVKWFLLSEELIDRGDLVVVAVSAGPDSMAMLSLLGELSRELNFRLVAAYFDHHIRDSGETDKRRIAALTKRLHIPLYSGGGDVRAAAAESGDTLEEAARKARYAFLYSLADQLKADRIATGHTRDDQVETVLMRVLRGTGIRGLAGIPVRRGRVIRPMLSVSREQVMRYLAEAGIEYELDPGNEERRFFRNRLRHDLLPMLRRDFNEGVDRNLERLAESAGEVIGAVRSRTDRLMRQHVRHTPSGEWIVNLASLRDLDDVALVVFLGDVLAERVGCDLDFTRKHYEAILSLIHNASGSGKMLDLPGVTVRKEYENLIISRERRANGAGAFEYRAALTVPGEISAAGVVVRTEIVDREKLESTESGPRSAVFALDKLKLPLVLRGPARGDRMRPFGMAGTKKISDIFTDKKIPGRMRHRSLVVADAEEILWLVGVATAEKSRIGSATDKVVRITVEDEGGRP